MPKLYILSIADHKVQFAQLVWLVMSLAKDGHHIQKQETLNLMSEYFDIKDTSSNGGSSFTGLHIIITK